MTKPKTSGTTKNRYISLGSRALKNDASAKLNLGLVENMVQKLLELKQLRADRERLLKAELRKAQTKFKRELLLIEQDLVLLETAIKELVTQKEYYMILRRQKDEIESKQKDEIESKPEDIKTKDTQDNIVDNNDNKEVKTNGSIEM